MFCLQLFWLELLQPGKGKNLRPGQASHAQTVQTLKGFGKDPRVLEKTFGLQPCLGYRSKKPWGSGTTSNVRRAKRANIQWDYLEEQGADTDTPRGLAKHVAALERAMQKAKAKLNGQEEEQEPLEKGTSSRGRSSTPKAKPLEKGQRASRSSSKKGKPLEKGKGKGQGKGPGTTRSRSTSAKGKGKEGKGKKGKKGKKGLKGKGFGKGQESEEEEECEEVLVEEMEEPKEEAKEEVDQANNNVGGQGQGGGIQLLHW